MYLRFYVTLKTGRVIVYDISRNNLEDELDHLNSNPEDILTYYYKEV